MDDTIGQRSWPRLGGNQVRPHRLIGAKAGCSVALPLGGVLPSVDRPSPTLGDRGVRTDRWGIRRQPNRRGDAGTGPSVLSCGAGRHRRRTVRKRIAEVGHHGGRLQGLPSRNHLLLHAQRQQHQQREHDQLMHAESAKVVGVGGGLANGEHAGRNRQLPDRPASPRQLNRHKSFQIMGLRCNARGAELEFTDRARCFCNTDSDRRGVNATSGQAIDTRRRRASNDSRLFGRIKILRATLGSP